jgi:hypothetical protein
MKPFPGAWISVVAQVSNLLYRSASSLRRVENPNDLRAVQTSADWKSAIQQVGNLRYVSADGARFFLQ